VRATIDWRDEAAVDAQLFPEFRAKRALWDATFGLPYHLFRHRVKEIAQRNLAEVRGVTVSSPADLPDGALVVPVDDDDWFAPDLADHLARAYDPAARGYRWPLRVMQARLPGNPLSRLLHGRRDPLRAEHTEWTCGTNNYAVLYEGAWKETLRSHGEASRRFDAEPGAVRRLDATLSLQNRNLSSQTLLGWRKPPIGRNKLLRRYRRHRRFYHRVALPPGLAWARPYVAAMAELMDELQPARSASQTDGGS
jgi:hypothetical protein